MKFVWITILCTVSLAQGCLLQASKCKQSIMSVRTCSFYSFLFHRKPKARVAARFGTASKRGFTKPIS